MNVCLCLYLVLTTIYSNFYKYLKHISKGFEFIYCSWRVYIELIYIEKLVVKLISSTRYKMHTGVPVGHWAIYHLPGPLSIGPPQFIRKITYYLYIVYRNVTCHLWHKDTVYISKIVKHKQGCSWIVVNGTV